MSEKGLIIGSVITEMLLNKKTVRLKTYSSSLFSTCGHASVRVSSLYNLKRMRNMHAKLCVSCFSRFGLAFPLKPVTVKKQTIIAIYIIYLKEKYARVCVFE